MVLHFSKPEKPTICTSNEVIPFVFDAAAENELEINQRSKKKNRLNFFMFIKCDVTETKEGECSSLIQIMLPTSIEKISENSFEGCISLKKVTISSTVKLIKSSYFS